MTATDKAPQIPSAEMVEATRQLVLSRLAEHYTAEEALQWILLPNPQLEDETALDFIHAGRESEVVAILDRLDAFAYL